MTKSSCAPSVWWWIYNHFDLSRGQKSSFTLERHHTARDGTLYYNFIYSQWDIKKSSFRSRLPPGWLSLKKILKFTKRTSFWREALVVKNWIFSNEVNFYWCRDEPKKFNSPNKSLTIPDIQPENHSDVILKCFEIVQVLHDTANIKYLKFTWKIDLKYLWTCCYTTIQMLRKKSYHVKS